MKNRIRHSNKKIFILALFVLIALTACGGGDDGSEDDNGEDVLADYTQFSTVASARVIVPGAECPAGGIVVDSGIDENSNGELDASEVDTSEIICNGEDGADGLTGTDGTDGLNALVSQAVEPAGDNCTDGGVRFDIGIDNNPTNGVLDAAEITSTEYACNGADGIDGQDGTNGTDGADGSDGLTSLVALSDEDSGINCTFGGTRIETGIDNNGNSVLESSEVTATEFICALTSDSFDGLLYTADANINGMNELFRTGRDAEASQKLIGPRSFFGDVSIGIDDVKISPDRTKVAVRGDLETDGIIELFVIRLVDGSAPIKVSGEMVTGGNVFSDFKWSPNSSRLAYRADQNTNSTTELFSVFADGTGNRRVNDILIAGGNVSSFEWSPDSNRLAYRADKETDNDTELYTALADGSGNTKVSGTLVAGGDVQSGFQWSPDGSRLAYRADQETDQAFELYTVTATGANLEKVSGTLVANGSVVDYSWSPDGSRLAYLADQDVDSVFKLFTVRPDATNRTEVNGALVPGGSVFSYKWSPDSSLLAYRAYQDTVGVVELYTVAPGGTNNAKVSGTLADNTAVNLEFEWAPDSSRLAYLVYENDEGWLELYTVRPDGSANTKVNGTLVNGGSVSTSFKWSPTGSQIAYTADQDTNNTVELYTVAADGTNRTKVNGDLVAEGDVSQSSFKWAPDGTRLAYLADQDSDEVVELFTVAADGSDNIKVSGELVNSGDVDKFYWD